MDLFMQHVKTLLTLLIGLFFSFSVHAGGGLSHMYLAEEAITQLSDSTLRHVLLENKDAYLVGAHYPDSGFVPGTGYGEDSHWDPFIFTFADYIKEKYRYPELENPKLVAFLMGCASHRVSDEIIHFTFYPYVSEKDFNGNDFKAHKHGDIGIDMLVNIEKGRWRDHPKTWWVPVSDLLEVYHRMGLDQYTAEQITYGNSLLNIAGYLERVIALPTYPYLRWRMPWTAKNYYDWPQGGMLMDIEHIAKYQSNLWQRIKDAKSINVMTASNHKKYDYDSVMTRSAKQAFEDKIVRIVVNQHSDGSIELQSPLITDQTKYRDFISTLLREQIYSH